MAALSDIASLDLEQIMHYVKMNRIYSQKNLFIFLEYVGTTLSFLTPIRFDINQSIAFPD